MTSRQEAAKFTWVVTDLTNGKRLQGGREMSQYFGYAPSVCTNFCSKGVSEIAGRPVKIEKISYGSRHCRPVKDLRTGQIWPAVTVAARELGINPVTLAGALREHRQINGLWLRKV